MLREPDRAGRSDRQPESRSVRLMGYNRFFNPAVLGRFEPETGVKPGKKKVGPEKKNEKVRRKKD